MTSWKIKSHPISLHCLIYMPGCQCHPHCPYPPQEESISVSKAMAWSAKNATKAFLQTLRSSGNLTSMEPDIAEFVSALAAGCGARLMVEVSSAGLSAAAPTTRGLIAAAQQTGGRVVCIVPGEDDLRRSTEALGPDAGLVELATGDARSLLLSEYRGADFVLVDGQMHEHESVLQAARASAAESSGGGARVDLLPIRGGLSVCRASPPGTSPPTTPRKSQWVVRVDQCTGEEHVFRISSPRRKWIEA